MQMSFRSQELAQQRLKRDNVLMKIDVLIERERLRRQLTGYTSANYRMVEDRNRLMGC